MIETRIERFFSRWKGKKIAVIGVGVSNTDVIRLFASKGLDVTLCERKTREQLGPLATELEQLGVSLLLEGSYLGQLYQFAMILRAPGVYFHRPELEDARKAGCVVTSEMELFFSLCPCPIYAVTGSDGKTTTTTLIAEMLKAQGKRVHLGGNIGRALLPLIEEISPEDRAVVELSSFQLISMRHSPDVAVVTNLSPNHLDVHGTMEEYIQAKKNLILHQEAFSRTVLNGDNPITAEFASLVRGQCCFFSRCPQQPPTFGAYTDEQGDIWAAWRDEQGVRQSQRVMNQRDIRIPGLHNVENYLAAITAVWGEVSQEKIRQVAGEFAGVEHRIEFVRELDGVKWYNESIATSPTRTIAGLKSFDRKLIVLAGGYDKKIPFAPMVPHLLERAKALILTGATAEKIEAAVKADPGYSPERLPIFHGKDLEDSVQIARAMAVEGDIVTLSPACASFDSYPNFEARGRHFKALVNALE